MERRKDNGEMREWRMSVVCPKKNDIFTLAVELCVIFYRGQKSQDLAFVRLRGPTKAAGAPK